MGLIMSINDFIFRRGNYSYVWFLWLPTIISFIRYGKWFIFLMEQDEKQRKSKNLEDLNTDSEEESNWYKVPIVAYPVFGLGLITVVCSSLVQIVELPLDSRTFLVMFLVLSILNLGYLILFQFVVSRE